MFMGPKGCHESTVPNEPNGPVGPVSGTQASSACLLCSLAFMIQGAQVILLKSSMG